MTTDAGRELVAAVDRYGLPALGATVRRAVAAIEAEVTRPPTRWASVPGVGQLPSRHTLPVPGEHVASADCWCRPTADLVRYVGGHLAGVQWSHRETRRP